MKRYLAKYQTQFCGMPPLIEHTDFYYSESETPEQDFVNSLKLDDGEILISSVLSDPRNSILTKELIQNV